jgi:hypothetical protein
MTVPITTHDWVEEQWGTFYYALYQGAGREEVMRRYQGFADLLAKEGITIAKAALDHLAEELKK